MNHLLELDGIQLEYLLYSVLQDIYMKCETGSIVGLLGRNGSGKSSLLQIIFGTIKPYMKSIRIDERNILETNIRKRFISYLPQRAMLPAYLNVSEVLSVFRLNEREWLNAFPEMEALMKSKVAQLSGGEKRILEIFCILKQESMFVLLDEPFSYLSPVYNERIIQLLHETKKTKGILITDHSYRYLLEVCDRFYLLQNGKTFPLNDKEDVYKTGYLGEL